MYDEMTFQALQLLECWKQLSQGSPLRGPERKSVFNKLVKMLYRSWIPQGRLTEDGAAAPSRHPEGSASLNHESP